MIMWMMMWFLNHKSYIKRMFLKRHLLSAIHPMESTSTNHHTIHPAHKISLRNRSNQQQNKFIDHHQSIFQVPARERTCH